MAVFYPGDDVNAVGGPARILVTNFSNAAPASLQEIFSLSTYVANASYNWKECGLTTVPADLSVKATMKQWKNEQNGLYRNKPMDWEGGVKSVFLETDPTHKLNILGFTTAPTPAVAGEIQTNYPAAISVPRVRIAVCFLDDLGRIHARVYPYCQWNGDALAIQISRGDPVTIPMTWTAYPDDNKVDTATGQPLIAYDLDQTL